MIPLAVVQPDDPPRIFSDVHGRVFRRTGYCCRCGECCINPDAPGGMCPLWREAGGVGECSERMSPYYLAGCVDWPSKPEHLLGKPSCTYRFERVG